MYIDHLPDLTDEAIITLKYDQGGISTFEQVYGDYYVLGYNLGGDHAMTVSTSSRSDERTEVRTLTAKAEAFLLNVDYTTQTSSSSSSGNADLRVVGYDTLSGSNMDRLTTWASSATLDFNRVQMETSDLLTMGDRLATRVEECLCRVLGLPTGESTSRGPVQTRIDRSTCKSLIESGLVVELVLLPVRQLRDVQAWMLEDDII